MKELKELINILNNSVDFNDEEFKRFTLDFLDSLNKGEIRAAEPLPDGNWKVNIWVKQGILLLFKYGKLIELNPAGDFNYFDKDTLPLHPLYLNDGLRIVPGGSSIRSGSFIAKGVICMPPMFINIGAYIDEGTMIDSHALVGTCAQIGKRVHLSAAAQVGGVLEPSGAMPVIIEDEVLVGGNCGIFEGVRVGKRAVLASGVILTASTKIYDLVNEKIITGNQNEPLKVPDGAVLVPGSRKIKGDFADVNGLSIYTPLIIKYRDSKTDAKTALELALR